MATHATPAFPLENPALVDAFITYRDALAALRATEPSADDAPFLAIMDPADDLLRDEPAHTPQGVAMKLKRAFAALAGEAWSDAAVDVVRPADFDDCVKRSDIYLEMFWSAVKDLERMSQPRTAAAEPSAWDAALAEYRKAWALWDELTGDYSDEESNAVSAVAHPALETMIDTPAPNAAALVIKIEEARRDQRAITDDDLDAILADVRRLAAREGR